MLSMALLQTDVNFLLSMVMFLKVFVSFPEKQNGTRNMIGNTRHIGNTAKSQAMYKKNHTTYKAYSTHTHRSLMYIKMMHFSSHLTFAIKACYFQHHISMSDTLTPSCFL